MAATSNAARSPGGSAGFIHGSACAKTIDDDARMPAHATSSVEHTDSNLAMSMVSSIHKCCSTPRSGLLCLKDCGAVLSAQTLHVNAKFSCPLRMQKTGKNYLLSHGLLCKPRPPWFIGMK